MFSSQFHLDLLRYSSAGTHFCHPLCHEKSNDQGFPHPNFLLTRPGFPSLHAKALRKDLVPPPAAKHASTPLISNAPVNQRKIRKKAAVPHVPHNKLSLGLRERKKISGVETVPTHQVSEGHPFDGYQKYDGHIPLPMRLSGGEKRKYNTTLTGRTPSKAAFPPTSSHHPIRAIIWSIRVRPF